MEKIVRGGTKSVTVMAPNRSLVFKFLIEQQPLSSIFLSQTQKLLSLVFETAIQDLRS